MTTKVIATMILTMSDNDESKMEKNKFMHKGKSIMSEVIILTTWQAVMLLEPI